MSRARYLESIIESLYRDVSQSLKNERELLLSERRGETNKYSQGSKSERSVPNAIEIGTF